MIHQGPGKASHIPLTAVRVSGFSMVQSLQCRVLSRESVLLTRKRNSQSRRGSTLSMVHYGML